jgi:hypothetical protein
MATWRKDPYLWVHLAGLATVPLWLDLCLLGLAMGNPSYPVLELALLGLLGVLPVLGMQLLRPFYIFAVLGVALRPRALSDDQRRLLSQFRHWRVRLGVLLVPLPLAWGLLKLYPLAFLARDLIPFDGGRSLGLAIALGSFALANLFLQVPVAVIQVLLTSDRAMARVSPYPLESVATDFMVLGLPVGRLLPAIVDGAELEPQTGHRPTHAPEVVASAEVNVEASAAVEYGSSKVNPAVLGGATASPPPALKPQIALEEAVAEEGAVLDALPSTGSEPSDFIHPEVAVAGDPLALWDGDETADPAIARLGVLSTVPLLTPAPAKGQS